MRAETSVVLLGGLLVMACSAGDGDAAGEIHGEVGPVDAGAGPDGGQAAYSDPGPEPWEPVPRDRVAELCGLDPDLLDQADERIGRSWAVVRYGRLCHEHYPAGQPGVNDSTEAFSATKTLGAVAVGRAAYVTRDLERKGRKTGPVSDEDRVDHWLDDFAFNSEARVAHVLAMVAHNDNLAFGEREFQYDATGSVQINRLSDIVRAAIAQDPERLGGDVEEFVQRHLFGPLGMRASSWTGGAPDKTFGFTWAATVRDMARLGLLILHDGVWNGERLLDADWVYRMTRPAFEDANTGYGYLTWLFSASNYTFGGILGPGKLHGRMDPCTPVAVHHTFPHGLSEATDCHYEPPHGCEQQHDVGVWFAAGLGGQYIVGHRGLDLVFAVKDLEQGGTQLGPMPVWTALRPALVALDPEFAGDDDTFCRAYAAGDYAPDLIEAQ